MSLNIYLELQCLVASASRCVKAHLQDAYLKKCVEPVTKLLLSNDVPYWILETCWPLADDYLAL
jgi:hypothetical protein